MVAISKAMQDWAVTAAAAYMGMGHTQLGGCDIKNVSLSPIPSGQATIASPPNLTASFVGVAFGVQNYTCTSSNNYTNVGAVAELFDISCIASTDIFDTIQEPLFQAWSNLTDGITVQEAINFLPHILPADLILAQHYFVPNTAGAGLSPKWDFRATRRFRDVEDAIFVGRGLGTLPDPVDPVLNVAWLDVGHVQGDIADVVFRTQTHGGQPPTSCTFGTSPNITVKYTSKYWFFGGSLTGTYDH